MTQQDVARQIKVTRPTLAQWEGGRHLPSAANARRLDELLDAGQELVRLAAAARPDSSPSAATAEPGTSLLHVFRRVAAGLVDRLDRDEAGVARGWRHKLQDEQPRTALSTAYGIKTLLQLDAISIDLRPLEQTIRELELPGGGWSSRAQSRARPEATAVVLDALFRLSTDRDADQAVALLDASFRPESWRRPFVLSNVLEAVLRIAPASELAERTIAGLLDCRLDYDGVLLWPEKVNRRNPVKPDPSVAHTAQAVAALLLSDDVRVRPEVAAAVAAAADWLQSEDRFGGVTEELESDDPATYGNRVSVRHFTSAWAAIALSRLERPPQGPIRTAVDVVWSRYQPSVGLWAWGDADLPIWMTHDSVLALRSAALASFPGPRRSPET